MIVVQKLLELILVFKKVQITIYKKPLRDPKKSVFKNLNVCGSLVSLSFYAFLGLQAEAGPLLMIGTQELQFLQSNLRLLLQLFFHHLFSLPLSILCPTHLESYPHSTQCHFLRGNNLPLLSTCLPQVIPLPQQMYPVPGCHQVLSPHSQTPQYPQYLQHTFYPRRNSIDNSVD